MTRILYRIDGTHTPRGGHKVAFRHLEALRERGFDARALMPDVGIVPAWFSHTVPVIREREIESDDVIVVAEGNLPNLVNYANRPNKKVVFCQNQFYAAAYGLAQLPTDILHHYDDYIACSDTVAKWLSRFVPHRSITVVSAFADDRIFLPKTKSPVIALMPGKRELEWGVVTGLIKRLYRGSPFTVNVIANKSESEVAAILGQAGIFVSLSRLEGLGMATLEAMASGCLVVGFKGIGGSEYATTANGLWVDDDDCEGCADALLDAMTAFASDRPRVDRVVSAGRATAARYSHSAFVDQLLRFWEVRVPLTSSTFERTPP